MAATLLALGLVSLVVALARPVMADEVGVERGTVVLAIDVSLSMAADDVDPTRLDAAKEAALAFLDQAPADISLGLVTFAETAQVDLAPSLDRAPLRRAVESMTLRPGTGIGEAIFASLDALAAVGAIDPLPGSPLDGPTTTVAATPPRDRADGDAPARIVVMSDGETTMGRPNEQAARAAADAGVPVWTIAFGTTHGTIDYEGQVVLVPTNGPALAEVAEATGGKSFTAAQRGRALRRLLRRRPSPSTPRRSSGTWRRGSPPADWRWWPPPGSFRWPGSSGSSSRAGGRKTPRERTELVLWARPLTPAPRWCERGPGAAAELPVGGQQHGVRRFRERDVQRVAGGRATPAAPSSARAAGRARHARAATP